MMGEKYVVGNEKRKVQDKKNNRDISFCALLTSRLGEVKSTTRVKATRGEKKNDMDGETRLNKTMVKRENGRWGESLKEND